MWTSRMRSGRGPVATARRPALAGSLRGSQPQVSPSTVAAAPPEYDRRAHLLHDRGPSRRLRRRRSRGTRERPSVVQPMDERAPVPDAASVATAVPRATVSGRGDPGRRRPIPAPSRPPPAGRHGRTSRRAVRRTHGSARTAARLSRRAAARGRSPASYRHRRSRRSAFHRGILSSRSRATRRSKDRYYEEVRTRSPSSRRKTSARRRCARSPPSVGREQPDGAARARRRGRARRADGRRARPGPPNATRGSREDRALFHRDAPHTCTAWAVATAMMPHAPSTAGTGARRSDRRRAGPSTSRSGGRRAARPEDPRDHVRR
jgi:hypothetical protein